MNRKVADLIAEPDIVADKQVFTPPESRSVETIRDKTVAHGQSVSTVGINHAGSIIAAASIIETAADIDIFTAPDRNGIPRIK